LNNKEQPAGDAGGLIGRLFKRHVIQSAAIYIAVAWGAVEILLTLQEKLGWPEWLSRVALALFIAGFPIVIIWSWFKDLQSRWAKSAVVVVAIALASTAFLMTLSSDPVPRAPAAKLPPVSATIATVAIIPFENVTGDQAYEYLVNGFTGELIGRLSKHPDLAVIQEESIKAPLLARLIPAAMAARVNADYLVRGSVLREDKYIEVNASLQDLDGQVLWSENLREPYSAESVVSMQRRISGEVSRVLGTTLEAPAYCGETTDLGALELYYRGRMAIGTRDTDQMLEGINLLKQAVEEDPYFGRAWSVLGSGQLVMRGRLQDLGATTEEKKQAGLYYSMAMSAMKRALEICPTIGGAYKTLVPPYEGIDNDSIDQEMQWRDALAMDPNDAALLRQYAFHLMQHGMNEEAIEALQRAYEIEPLMAMIPHQFAHALSLEGRCDEAMPLAREAESLGGMPSVSIGLVCSTATGDLEAFIVASQGLHDLGFNSAIDNLDLTVEEMAMAYFEPDHPARPIMRERMRAIWEENPNPRENPEVYWIVSVAANIDDHDLVFEILDGFATEAGFYPYTVAWSPMFTSAASSSRLRADPRFKALIEKTGYPEYWQTYGWPSGCAADGDSLRCF
jgi:TolB-like protein